MRRYLTVSRRKNCFLLTSWWSFRVLFLYVRAAWFYCNGSDYTSHTISAGCANMSGFVKLRLLLVSPERSMLQQPYVLLDNCFATWVQWDTVRYRWIKALKYREKFHMHFEISLQYLSGSWKCWSLLHAPPTASLFHFSFHSLGFLGVWKIILGVSPCEKFWETLCYGIWRLNFCYVAEDRVLMPNWWGNNSLICNSVELLVLWTVLHVVYWVADRLLIYWPSAVNLLTLVHKPAYIM